MKETYLRTAAFAALAGVNKKTLHYYDEIGLFRPAYVNEKGYRFYSPFQLDRLALIVTLKDLGVPLKVIGEYLNGGDLARVDQILTCQSRELDRRIAQLTRRRALLETLRRQNRAFLDGCGKGPQRLHREPERIAVLMDRAEMESSRVLIVNYLTDGPGTGLCGEGEERFLYQRPEAGGRADPGPRRGVPLPVRDGAGPPGLGLAGQPPAAAAGLGRRPRPAAGRACLRGIWRPGRERRGRQGPRAPLHPDAHM